ncbi:MAG: hypothetical protein K2Q26_14525 [Bdellovibrionales bacterium]|nr:hypothetical protein [Bdellovibrionales bacterium]
MNHLLKVLFVMILHFPLFASATTASAVEKMADFFTRIDQEGELVDQNYFISFSSLSPSEEMPGKDQCFEKVNSSEVVDLVEAYAISAIEVLYGDTEKFSPFKDELTLRLQELGDLLKNKEIQMCTETSTPSYSDGHTTHVVRIDGQLSFIFEEGYPD